MSTSRLLTILEVIAAAVAAYAIVALDTAGIDYQLALQFLAAVFVLNLLDLSMPYGETMPVDSAIVVACLVLAGPLTAAFVTVVARLAVHLARGAGKGIDKTISLLSRRMVTVAVCGYLLAFMPGVGEVRPDEMFLQGLVAGIAFVSIELLLGQLQAAPRLHERVSQLIVGNAVLQGPLLAAQVSVAVLTVITYGEMNVWALVVMSLLMVLLRQSLALYLAIRQAYRSTIEAMVAAIEAQDPRRKGHAERVEALARAIALELGVRGRALESLGYAALLHDVDMLGSDYDDGDLAMLRHSADTVSSVRFLSEVVPILRLCDGVPHPDPPPHPVQQSSAVVAVASDMDDEANPRVGEKRAAAVDRIAAAGVDARVIDSVKSTAAEIRLRRALAP